MVHEENDRARIGRIGEEAAIRHLRSQGLRMVVHNWREGHYELDIIAERWGVLHFVEVKTRQADGLTRPELAITEQKSRSLRRAASAFLARQRIRYEGYDVQFDLVAVYHNEEQIVAIDWIERAIEANW